MNILQRTAAKLSMAALALISAGIAQAELIYFAPTNGNASAYQTIGTVLYNQTPAETPISAGVITGPTGPYVRFNTSINGPNQASWSHDVIGATIDPAIQLPTSIDISLDQRAPNGTGVSSNTPLFFGLRQGGNTYFYNTNGTTAVGFRNQTGSFSSGIFNIDGLTVADFGLFTETSTGGVAGGTNPDFSATGGEIQFLLGTFAGTGGTTNPHTRNADLQNLRIDVTYIGDPVPQSVLENNAVKIALIGDSTVQNTTGWGKSFDDRFDHNVQILNYAVGGRSSKSWYDEGRLPAVLAVQPDYVFIQFGHNDQPGKGAYRETDPDTTYRDHLRIYINSFKAIGTIPILVSSVTRRGFDPTLTFLEPSPTVDLTPWAEAARIVAAEENVPFISLFNASVKHHNLIGYAESMSYNYVSGDNTHLNNKGAQAITNLILNDLKTAVPALNQNTLSLKGDIAITNHSFEANVIPRDGNTATVDSGSDDYNSSLVPSGWIGFDDGRGGTSGNIGIVSHAKDGFFYSSLTDTLDADANDQSFFTAARDIYQVLGSQLEANTTYTLSIDIGDRNAADSAGDPGTPIVNLGYGATAGAHHLLSLSAADQTTQIDGNWVTWTGQFTTSRNPTGLGQALRLELTNGASVGWFDNVRLVATTASISVNFSHSPGEDQRAVDSAETALVGIAEAVSIDGINWNNLQLRSFTTPGAPLVLTAATQAGSHINLIDSTGTYPGVNMTTSGTFDTNTSNVSDPNQSTSGDAGLMQSYLLANDTESVAISGLSAWAPYGYKVIVTFDNGIADRTYGIHLTDGTTTKSYFTNDTLATDADPENDGLMNWIPTSATTSGSAVSDANFAVFETFTGDTLTLTGADSQQAAISGFQIVALSEPTATITSFTATPNLFTVGETVTLNWSVTDADSVSINQGIGNVTATGNSAQTPVANTTWILTATRGGTVITAETTAIVDNGPIDVYLLGGQSNMAGVGRKSKLPSGLTSIPEIKFYHSSNVFSTSGPNHWTTLQPAGSDGNSFGPEIGFGEILEDRHPGQSIAFIKHAKGGTSLVTDWKPGANASDTGNWGTHFTTFVNTVDTAIAALEADGYSPVIKGMIWQQGERDATDLTDSNNYGTNFSLFIGRVREQFAAHASPGGIRFVAGQVLPYAPAGGQVTTSYPGHIIVRQAILDADENSAAPLSVSNTGIVPTNSTDHPTHEQEVDGFRDTDEVHLNAAAQLTLGRSMAYKMLKLSPVTYAQWSTGHGLTGGQTDDDDGDGLDNLLEYYLGSHPLDVASSARSTGSIEAVEGQDYLTLSFLRNLNALDLDATAQVSEDLVNWNNGTAPVFIESINNEDGTATLTYRSPWSQSDVSHPRTFLRLHISPTP